MCAIYDALVLSHSFPPFSSHTLLISSSLCSLSPPPLSFPPSTPPLPSLFLSPPQVKEFIHSELLAELYAIYDQTALMDESLEQAQRREEVLRTHASLKEALDIITDISTSTASVPLPPPINTSWSQTSLGPSRRYRLAGLF